MHTEGPGGWPGDVDLRSQFLIRLCHLDGLALSQGCSCCEISDTSFVLRMLCGLNLRHRWSVRVVEKERRPGWRRGRAANAGDSLETEVVLDLQSLFAHDEVLLPLHQSGVAAAHLSDEGDFRVLLSSGFS